MKKLISILALALSFATFGTTLSPIQLLNPAGSSSGQVITSTGASSAPAWASIPATGLTGIVPIANGGTNASTASGTSLDNITGFSGTGLLDRTAAGAYSFVNPATYAPTASPTFTGTLSAAAITASGTITPNATAGIVGTTGVNNAQAGSVGEYITATGTAISLVDDTAKTITSISLTAGDWDVEGNIYFNPATATNLNITLAGISTTTNVLPAIPLYTYTIASGETDIPQTAAAPIQRINVSSTTTVYLVGSADFVNSTLTATGIIQARRIR